MHENSRDFCWREKISEASRETLLSRRKSFHLFSILEYFSIPTVGALQALEHACKNAGNNWKTSCMRFARHDQFRPSYHCGGFKWVMAKTMLLQFMRFHDFLLFRAYVERNHLELLAISLTNSKANSSMSSCSPGAFSSSSFFAERSKISNFRPTSQYQIEASRGGAGKRILHALEIRFKVVPKKSEAYGFVT